MYTKLHALRGVSACLVILFHSPYKFEQDPQSFIANCYLFVDLFFLISGFVMSCAYVDKIKGDMGFVQYLGLRFARLYPLHAFMLIVWLGFVLVRQYLHDSGFGGADQYVENNGRSLLANILLLHSMGFTDSLSWNQPSWSIAAEFYTYVVFYLTTRYLDNGKSLAFPLLITLAFYGYLFFFKQVQTLDLTYDYGFIRCIPAFYFGVFIFRVHRRFTKALNGYKLSVAEAAAISATVIGMLYARENVVALIVAVLSFGVVVLVFSSTSDGVIGVLLKAGWLQKLGLWSYSIYMTHKLILVCSANIAEYFLHVDLQIPLGLLSPLINIGLIAIVIALSRLTYIYIEQHFRIVIGAAIHRRAYASAQPSEH